MVTMTVPTAVLIGNFDGVHAGHRHLVDVARSLVSDQGRVVAVFFDPHPAALLQAEAQQGSSGPVPLTTPLDRIRLLESCGVDHVEVIQTTLEVLAMTPETFLHWLTGLFSPQWIVEGRDFRFGRGRVGTVQTLAELGEDLEYQVRIVDPVEVSLDDQSVVTASSSLARTLVEHGRVGDAAHVLRRPHRLSGNVRRGEQWGRHVGIPTANLDDLLVVIPADGVYAGWATDDQGQWHDAAISVGTRPSFGANPRVVEVHLCECSMSLESYGWQMDVEVMGWIRDQVAYDDHVALVDQMGRDIASCRHLLAASRWSSRRDGAVIG